MSKSISNQQEVIIQYAPISERYWHSGCSAIIRNGQIRTGGCWFQLSSEFQLMFN